MRRPWDWLDTLGWVGFALLVLWLLSGCVSVRVEPLLSFPDPPTLQWTVCRPTNVCLSDADGDRLAKWMDKVAAYRAAIKRMEDSR